jgi:hypothetical protein
MLYLLSIRLISLENRVFFLGARSNSLHRRRPPPIAEIGPDITHFTGLE